MVYEVFVDCSSGTYIRSLAADLGSALGGGAHLRNLRRTGVGSFKEDEALPVEKIVLQSPIVGMRDFEVVEVNEETRKEVSYGRVFARDRLEIKKEGPWALVDRSGELLAVYKEHGDKIKPAVVIVDS
jgi:tRNA pseudouridine55 synthase